LEAASPAPLNSSKPDTPQANWSRDNTTCGNSLPVPPLSKTACAVSAAAWARPGRGRARSLGRQNLFCFVDLAAGEPFEASASVERQFGEEAQKKGADVFVFGMAPKLLILVRRQLIGN
jgi:hypothetical protein